MRVDCGVETGATVTPFYNSLLAKIIAFGADREEARRRLVSALEATFVAGVTTNRDLLIDVLRRPEFVDGKATTDFHRPRKAERAAAQSDGEGASPPFCSSSAAVRPPRARAGAPRPCVFRSMEPTMPPRFAGRAGNGS